MISEQTIRTVISICPKWSIQNDYADHNSFWIKAPGMELCHVQNAFPVTIDALAAEAVKTVYNKMPIIVVTRNSEVTISGSDGIYVHASSSANETENRLNAIAEFVEKGYLNESG